MALLSLFSVISTDSSPSFASLWERGQDLNDDWFGGKSKFYPHFLCAVDGSHFYFLAGGRGTAAYHPDGTEGKFQPDLWKYDVAEFFLASPDGSYLEFNLSPNGAWWSARFNKPRVARDLPPLAGVETVSEITDESWQVRAAIPLSELGSLEGALFNVTFILGSPAQQFFTAAPPGDGAPDFHRPDLFLPMSLPSRGDARQTES